MLSEVTALQSLCKKAHSVCWTSAPVPGLPGAGMHSNPQELESQRPFLVGAKAHGPETP